MSKPGADKYIDASALSALLRAHDGDVALLYLYLLAEPSADPERAAGALCRTLREVHSAWEKLQRMGLLPGNAAPKPARSPKNAEALLPPPEELPQYSAAEISARSQADSAFTAVLDEAAQVIGRKLSGNDLRVLYGIYDQLALPPEVILELLNYLAERYRERYGDSRRPGARAIEKEAYDWANRELLTLEQAEAHIRRQKTRREDLRSIQAVLGLRGRELGATEQKYIEGWLDLGFREEAIALALDRTLTSTGKLHWPYINKILLSWHQKGLHEPKEIEEKDPRGRKSAAPARQDKPMDIEGIQKLIGKI